MWIPVLGNQTTKWGCYLSHRSRLTPMSIFHQLWPMKRSSSKERSSFQLLRLQLDQYRAFLHQLRFLKALSKALKGQNYRVKFWIDKVSTCFKLWTMLLWIEWTLIRGIPRSQVVTLRHQIWPLKEAMDSHCSITISNQDPLWIRGKSTTSQTQWLPWYQKKKMKKSTFYSVHWRSRTRFRLWLKGTFITLFNKSQLSVELELSIRSYVTSLMSRRPTFKSRGSRQLTSVKERQKRMKASQDSSSYLNRILLRSKHLRKSSKFNLTRDMALLKANKPTSMNKTR